MLQNRIYRGEIVHKDKAYPGLHEAIIDEELWNEVQAALVDKRQLAELVRTMSEKSDLAKARTITLKPGARLVREWDGETHEILVVEDGFEWRGKTWRSLSAIARELTGTHWSGPRFFGLKTGQTDG